MICTEEDDFSREFKLAEARWTAVLSDGTTVFQDEGRPGTALSSWLRLKDYVEFHKLGIASLKLQFRDEKPLRLPDNADGYFFRQAAGCFNGGPSFGFRLIGYLREGEVHLYKVQVPEMIVVEKERRDPGDHEKVGISLIRNPSS